ncbi:MAG: hypothetical protein WC696_01275 [Candidatus Methylopumilus sp.]|jgi:hypothetical protein
MMSKAEYKLAVIQPKKTHPLVLVAATGLTIFSILGSAAITGLIPHTQSERAVDVTANRSIILTLPDPTTPDLVQPESKFHQTQDGVKSPNGAKLKQHQQEHIMSDLQYNQNIQLTVA